jgi:hypothetical protein
MKQIITALLVQHNVKRDYDVKRFFQTPESPSVMYAELEYTHGLLAELDLYHPENGWLIYPN